MSFYIFFTYTFYKIAAFFSVLCLGLCTAGKYYKIKSTALKNKMIFIIDFQSMYELPCEKGYLPCELACVKFSLQEGIVDTYHTFVNPGWLKLHK